MLSEGREVGGAVSAVSAFVFVLDFGLYFEGAGSTLGRVYLVDIRV